MNNSYNTLIIGSGCAGFNAADCLYDLGIKNIALITEGVNMGTSRNTGSDKQTYYKLTLAGDSPDSVEEMAQTLYSGGSANGDNALIEAANSATAFIKLVNLGLPFPTNEYGAFVGYKTDHDPRQRATSCGPLTSKLMTEALEKSVRKKGITIIDNRQVIKLLADDNKIYGLATINKETYKYETYHVQNIILATGGSAGIYENVVYPQSQTGGTGLALDMGAKAANLQEWQYGLASTDFRWNVSGTYQQVLPKYISVDKDGTEHEFLPAHFDKPVNALDMVFLKGYQWPFDVRKIEGSSRIDLLVAEEINKGRKVYMDFRHNPQGVEQGFEGLSTEAYAYLEKSNALFGTPIERLAKMNPKAIDLYKNNGIDLYKEPLRVAVCAQHCNGGIAVDANWESSVSGLYVAGEAAGTFGVYRPGGSALNSTQVGAMRAARHIAGKASEKVDTSKQYSPAACVNAEAKSYNRKETSAQMSRYAAYVRNPSKMEELYEALCDERKDFFVKNTVESEADLPELYKSYDILLTQIAVLSAMIYSAEHIGSRGSAIVKGADSSNGSHNDKLTITQIKGLIAVTHFEQVRPLPICDDWFETVWAKM